MVEFDQQITRKNTHSVKWDGITETYHASDLLPLWVADMDFLSPKSVTQALSSYVQNGLFGYSTISNELYNSIIQWEKKQHQVTIKKEEIVFSSGVLSSLAVGIQTFTEIGDSIMIHDPVYPPFSSIVENNQRKLVRSSLIEKNNHFEMDFADMEQKIQQHNIKALILCNPHNPGGRVWSKAELTQLTDLCLNYQVFIFSDEIHQDLMLFGNQFTSMLTINPKLHDQMIAFTSATKTFNLAAIKHSMVFIKNKKLKAAFTQRLLTNQQQEINTFGLIGTQAAYETGETWLSELLPYLEENVSLVCSFFQEEMPDVRVMKPEGTYLMWLDFSAYETNDQELQDCFIKKGKVVLNPGISFGPAGHCHMRLNVACPKATLLEGLQRIKQSFEK